MKLKALRQRELPVRSFNKTLLVMKLTAIMLILCLQIFARGHAQERITINEKNVPLEVVLKEIQKQAGYQYFILDKWKQVAKRIDIAVTNATLAEVLEICFRNQPFTYSIVNKIIVVQEKPKLGEFNSDPPKGLLEVKGHVRAESGAPLPGATVTLKGTKKGGLTDNNGQFVLRGVAPGRYILEISFVGYQTYETAISVTYTSSDVTAVLKQASNILDETQVIAYGTTTRRMSTGNVTTVKAAEIERQPVSNPLLALEGRVPGLFINQASGFAGSGVTVRIQGINSIGNGNDPLYVIDGVPYISELLPTLANTMGSSGGPLVKTNGLNMGTYGNPLSYINPADIESIDVLKDADATAIYGSRAANGAILITTKKGKAGEQMVELNLKQGWGGIARRMKLLDLRQYLDMRYEALRNDGISLAQGSLTDPTFYDLKGWDTTRSTDWQNALIGNTDQYTDLQSTVSGGSSNTVYSIGAGYHRETSVLPGDFDDRNGSLHFQINSNSANQKFKLRLTGNYMADFNRLPTTGDRIMQMALQLPPDAPALYNKDGSINWALDPAGSSTWRNLTNPVAELLNKFEDNTYNLVNNVLLSYQFAPGLYVKSSFGYTRIESNEKMLGPLAAKAPQLRSTNPRSGVYRSSNVSSWIAEPQINYTLNLAKGKLEALLGSTIEQRISQSLDLSASGFTSDAALEDVSAASTVVAGLGMNVIYNYNALFSRLNYNWEGKYILNLTARRDGSSRFGPQSQFHDFGSMGAAWIFTEEGSFKKKLSFLSFGKLSASYGTTGNDQIGDYQFYSLYFSNPYGVPYQGVATLQPNNLPNPYLEWEETRKLQTGMDLGLLKDLILINVGYSINRSSNQLLAYQLPVTTGFSSVTANFPATVQNTEWEITISSTNIKAKKFKWSTSINLTIPRNKLIAFPNLATSTYANVLVVGKPITIVKAFHLIGVDPSTGGYYFDSKTNPFNPQSPGDLNSLETSSPDFYGGIQNSVSYDRFDVDFLFQFVRRKGPDYVFGFFPGSPSLNQPVYVLDRWRKPGDIASHQRYNSDYSLANAYIDAANGGSDGSFGDASYMRLKNIAISWLAPEKWLRSIRMRGIRIFVQAQNLLTLTRYQGLDPENLSWYSLPPLRVITSGVKLTF